MEISQILAIAALVFGFGFVVFFHELGHFLAAKWVGIKVEQFAVGFGQALIAWRKGVGPRVGTTTPEYERRIKEHLTRKLGAEPKEISSNQAREASEELGLGETEYRLNWIPLGGYVKMLGQDDMNPNAQSDDPRAYNRKSISARMLVVSAGVIMNVILAAIGFMVVFMMGYNVPPAVVGQMAPGSPAQRAGLEIGDRITWFDGTYQHDFNKLALNTALVEAGTPVPVTIIRDGQEKQLTLRPEMDPVTGFLSIGVRQASVLTGLDPKKVKEIPGADPAKHVLPGEAIVAINGVAVDNPKNYELLDEAVQQSAGKPVLLTVRNAKGEQREVKADVTFQPFYGTTPFGVAGMQPRPVIESIMDESPVKGKLKEGDIVTSVRVNGEPRHNPTVDEFVKLMSDAGANEWKVSFEVVRDGQKLPETEAVVPDVRVGRGKRGIGVGFGFDEKHAVVAGALPESPAAAAGIVPGSIITRVNGQQVTNWFDVHQALKQAGETAELTVIVPSQTREIDQDLANVPAERKHTVTLNLDEKAREKLAQVRYGHELLLAERIEEREASNPLEAAWWGVTETRDLLPQFYVTLHRLVQGSVSATNFMGPIGIVHAGSIFAGRGVDWLLWFLAMISANLAVVNFLPIPIVDGGLFAFLILEKIQGKPLSARMQTVAQLVGLAIILSVFVLVTYQDIARLFL